MGIPFTKFHDLLASDLDRDSRSTLPSMVTRVGWWLLPVRGRLIEEMKAAPVKYADETTWPVNAKDGWAWHFATQDVAVFVMEPMRGAAVPKGIFGKRIYGTLVSDDYGVYLGMSEER